MIVAWDEYYNILFTRLSFICDSGIYTSILAAPLVALRAWSHLDCLATDRLINFLVTFSRVKKIMSGLTVSSISSSCFTLLNINRLMSEEMLSNDRWVEKHLTPAGFEPLTSQLKNESVKKSLEKSNNVLLEKHKMVKQKNCIKKTNTFTIIAMNFVQEKLNTIITNEIDEKPYLPRAKYSLFIRQLAALLFGHDPFIVLLSKAWYYLGWFLAYGASDAG